MAVYLTVRASKGVVYVIRNVHIQGILQTEEGRGWQTVTTAPPADEPHASYNNLSKMHGGTMPKCQPPGSPPNVHHAQVVLRHARASTARVGSPQGQGRGGQQSRCSRRLPPSSNTLTNARRPPTHSYTHGWQSGCACKAPTLSVASSMRRCAWPSALRGMQGLELTPSKVPLSRPAGGPVGVGVGGSVGAGWRR